MSVYDDVTAGATILVPVSGTDPSPVSVADEPFVDDHESRDDAPFSIVVGFALSTHDGGGTTCGATVTDVWHVREPPGPATVSVNVRFDVIFETV